MRVAVAQYEQAGSLDANFNLIRQITERAEQDGIDLLCFSGDFLGFDQDQPDSLKTLLDLAREFEIEILTGELVATGGRRVQSALIGRDGVLIDTVPIGEIKSIRTCLGATIVLSQEQAYSEEVDALAGKLRPSVMVMQTTANSLLELEAIKELAISRSFNQAHLIICVSGVGRARDENFLGSSLAVFQGEIQVEADVDMGELLIFSVDLASFINYDELRDPVEIPELLKQKYSHMPTCTHDSE
ncbi:MAG: hypothetical protein KAX16_02845 [Actinomycetia bacterium]|nr:hypothetical protein [Actinomycetes bacterium]